MTASSVLFWACLLQQIPGAEPPGTSLQIAATTWTEAALGKSRKALPAKVPNDIRVEVDRASDGPLFVWFGNNNYFERSDRFVLQSGVAFDLASLKGRSSVASFFEPREFVLGFPPTPMWDEMFDDPFFGKDRGVGCITINGK